MVDMLERGKSSVSDVARWWTRRTARLAGTLVVVVLVFAAILALRRDPEPDCAAMRRTGPEAVAVAVCQREYEQTKLPKTGIHLATLRYTTANPTAAEELAKSLLETDARADALQLLAKLTLAKGRTDEAVTLIEEARKLHRAKGDHINAGIDAQVVVQIQKFRKQYADALKTSEECIEEGRLAKDARTEGFCRLQAASTLVDAGYFEAAQQEIDRAAETLSQEKDLAQLWKMRGDLAQDFDRGPLHRHHQEQAVVAFERSLKLARSAQLTRLIVHLHMNLAYSLAELGRTNEADQHLAEAATRDPDEQFKSERMQLAARIAFHRNDDALAFSLNEKAYPTIEDEDMDEKIEVCVMQARIALRRAHADNEALAKDLEIAAQWAQRGVDIAEKVRAEQTLSELRPWVLSSRRQPYELLFTAYVQAKRIEDAFQVFDQWQGRTLLDELARPSTDPSLGLSKTAARVQNLGRWLPAVSRAPLMASDGRAGTDALAKLKIDLVALAVAEHKVWRLTASRGQLRIDPLGDYEALEGRLDKFKTTPTDPVAAAELGELFLPEDVVYSTKDPLYMVLDAAFTSLPVVALRRNGQLLIAVRPVIRAPRFPVISECEPRAEIDSAVVLADAAGDLPDARRESSKVASRFSTTPLVGDAATSTALFAAKSDALLHVAVHADVDAGGGVLKLHDRAVFAPEVTANRLGPALVVLSACSTASSWDPESAGALSTAFLAAGSKRVIATLRSISDAGALELTTQFYSNRGAEDPARVLAEVQAKLAGSGNKEWPSFAVFGSEVCVPRA
jgi:tetratricopeptide (TPR) repeat protein